MWPSQVPLLKGCRSVALTSMAETACPSGFKSMPKLTSPARDWMDPSHKPVGVRTLGSTANATNLQKQNAMVMTMRRCRLPRVKKNSPQLLVDFSISTHPRVGAATRSKAAGDCGTAAAAGVGRESSRCHFESVPPRPAPSDIGLTLGPRTMIPRVTYLLLHNMQNSMLRTDLSHRVFGYRLHPLKPMVAGAGKPAAPGWSTATPEPAESSPPLRRALAAHFLLPLANSQGPRSAPRDQQASDGAARNNVHCHSAPTAEARACARASGLSSSIWIAVPRRRPTTLRFVRVPRGVLQFELPQIYFPYHVS